MKSLRITGAALFLAALGACGGDRRLAPGDLAGSVDMASRDSAMRPSADLASTDLADNRDLTVIDSGPLDGPRPDLPPPALNAVCANAKDITPSTDAGVVMLTGENSATGRDDIASTCRRGAHGMVLYYRLALGANTRVSITATPTGTTPPDLVVRMLPSCGAAACLAFADSQPAGGAETLTYVNTSSSPQNLIVAVGAYDTWAPGTFNLSVTTQALPSNLTCANAIVVTNGSNLTNQDASQGIDTQTASCLSGASGTVLYYTATVPVNSRLRVIATPTTSWEAVVRFLPACGATTCLNYVDATPAMTPGDLSWTNNGTAAQTVIIAVGSYYAATQGAFNLSVSITDQGPAPANRFCTAPMTVTDGASLTNQDASRGVENQTGSCLSFADGTVLYYSAVVPAMNRLHVTATPTGTPWELTIRVLDYCGVTSCLANTDAAPAGSQGQVYWNNGTAGPRTVLIAVGSYYASTTGTFSMTVNIGPIPPPPTNTTCAAAKTVTPGTPLMGEDVTTATVSLASTCGFGNGGNLFYTVTVPAGQTATVTGTPAGWDLVLRLLSTCGATSCLGYVDNNGGTDVVSWNNSAATPQPLIIAASPYSSSGTKGPFDLTVSLSTPPANIACSAATTVMNGTSLTGENDALAVDSTPNGTGCTSASGKVLYYKVTLPVGKTMTVTATPTGSPAWDMVISELDMCGNTTCRKTADLHGSGQAEILTETNSGATPLNLILTVGSYFSTTGTFNLTVSIP